jgi:hypothetical protein
MMRIASSFFLKSGEINMLLALIAALVAAQTAQEEKIDGYEYRCEAQRPQFLVSLILDEAGQHKQFFANYMPLRGAQDGIFDGEKPASMAKDKTYVSWQLIWREYNPSYPPKKFALKFENAELQLGFHSWRTLPQNVVMLAGAGKAISAYAERWPGRKTGAPFSFQLQNILDIARDSDAFSWAVYSGPLKANMSYKALRGEGTIDLQPLRAVGLEFDKLRSELMAKAADYKKQCNSEPVSYNPDAEI